MIQVKHGRGHGTVTCTIADAVTITVGIGAAATTSTGITAVTIISRVFAVFAFVTHCPDDSANGSDANGRALKARPVRPALNWRAWSSGEVQPSPISTAIRIRSEWFLAPSFCLSRDVVLATVL